MFLPTVRRKVGSNLFPSLFEKQIVQDHPMSAPFDIFVSEHKGADPT
jgi:phenylacetate-coenzyme A ligase PaaK-like adenylate-forming protein